MRPRSALRDSLIWLAVFAILWGLCAVAWAEPKAVLSQADLGWAVAVSSEGSAGVLDLFAVPADAPVFVVNDYALGPDGKPVLRPKALCPKGREITLVLVAAESKGGTVLLAREMLTIGGKDDGDDDDGDDDDQPLPPPPPDVKKVYAVIVYSSDARDDARYYDVLMEHDLDSLGPPAVYGGLLKIDADLSGQGRVPQSWIDRARGKPLPRLFVASDAGRVLLEADLPDDPADAERTILKYMPKP